VFRPVAFHRECFPPALSESIGSFFYLKSRNAHVNGGVREKLILRNARNFGEVNLLHLSSWIYVKLRDERKIGIELLCVWCQSIQL